MASEPLRPRSESSKRVIYVISDCTVCHGTGLLDAIVQGRGVQVFCACVITQRAKEFVDDPG